MCFCDIYTYNTINLSSEDLRGDDGILTKGVRSVEGNPRNIETNKSLRAVILTNNRGQLLHFILISRPTIILHYWGLIEFVLASVQYNR